MQYLQINDFLSTIVSFPLITLSMIKISFRLFLNIISHLLKLENKLWNLMAFAIFVGISGAFDWRKHSAAINGRTFNYKHEHETRPSTKTTCYVSKENWALCYLPPLRSLPCGLVKRYSISSLSRKPRFCQRIIDAKQKYWRFLFTVIKYM